MASCAIYTCKGGVMSNVNLVVYFFGVSALAAWFCWAQVFCLCLSSSLSLAASCNNHTSSVLATHQHYTAYTALSDSTCPWELTTNTTQQKGLLVHQEPTLDIHHTTEGSPGPPGANTRHTPHNRRVSWTTRSQH